MKKTSVLLIFFAIPQVIFAALPTPQAGDALFQDGRYSEALTLYSSLHHSYPKNVLYTYRLARCEQEEGMTDEAILHFEQAGSKFNLRNLYLGDLYYITYRFAEAAEMYRAYLNAIDDNHERYAEVQEQLSRTQRAQKMLSKTEDVCVFDSVVFPASQLLRHLPLNAEQGQFSMEEQHFTFSNQRGDRRFVVVEDASTGRHLICKQERLLDTWTALDTLPEQVNRFAQQGYPFLMPDGLTLYFSALSNQGLGEWDIYVTRYNPASDTWLNAEILNVPFNSIANDYLYFLDETSGVGYFLTDRHAPKGSLTLYSFIPNAEHKPLRDSSAHYVRQLAQLNILCDEKVEITHKEDMPQTDVKKEKVKPTDDAFEILITDTVIYSSFDDFSSDEAQQIAAQYLQQKKDYEAHNAELTGLREEYQAANEQTRNELRDRIITLEKTVRTDKRLLDSLLKDCRKAELEGL